MSSWSGTHNRGTLWGSAQWFRLWGLCFVLFFCLQNKLFLFALTCKKFKEASLKSFSIHILYLNFLGCRWKDKPQNKCIFPKCSKNSEKWWQCPVLPEISINGTEYILFSWNPALKEMHNSAFAPKHIVQLQFPKVPNVWVNLRADCPALLGKCCVDTKAGLEYLRTTS